MCNWIWHLIARLLARPAPLRWLRRWARVTERTPNIDGYMDRLTLIPFDWWPLPHVRLHCIRRPDDDRVLHDHPGDYRTIVLRGAYSYVDIFGKTYWRVPGDTACERAETFHRITQVIHAPFDEGVWTLFILYRRRHRWGFLVTDPATGDVRKIPYDKYLNL